jgi:uncharacterized protein
MIDNKNIRKVFTKVLLIVIVFCFCPGTLVAGDKNPKFRVIAFYKAENDQAHISFVHEANRWFSRMSEKYNFSYDSTRDWNRLNQDILSGYDIVIFLDARPDSQDQREAFQNYMEHGGAWMGFHFAAFALNHSDFPQDWDWYHNRFLGSGEYKSNTWRPTSAVLRVENRKHPAVRHLPRKFTSSPNEWYRWQNDLRKNPDIEILVSIDSSSLPLGTGPKPEEIWHSGYYPVVWTNPSYRMLYINMGHNDIDYENGTNKDLSHTFTNKNQNKLVINGLFWLSHHEKTLHLR